MTLNESSKISSKDINPYKKKIIYKPPTRIKIVGDHSSTIYKLTIAKLLMLGYDVVLPIECNKYPYNEFYHVIWDDSTDTVRPFYHFLFGVHGNRICIDNELSFFRKPERYTDNEFIDYCIFCWGLWRGNRLPMRNDGFYFEVGQDQIYAWKLSDK